MTTVRNAERPQQHSSVDAISKIELLERFVVENDALIDLERRIGRFNIFDALQIVRTEIRHSNFLAWLLDPMESHGQGALFLNAVLMNLLSKTPPALRPLSPVQLDGAELRGVDVRREFKHIDLLITCEHPRFVVAIENKIESGEHSNQLNRYRTTIGREFADTNAKQWLLVYLTKDGQEPSDDEWVAYSYRDLHQVLARVRDTHLGSIGDDVRIFLDHYLNLIGSRFMNNPEIDELCRKIYHTHRQAIDLIVERVGSQAQGITRCLEEVVTEQPDRWILVNSTSKMVQFVPATWKDLFPEVGRRPTFDRNRWMVLCFTARAKHLCSQVIVWPTTDQAIRDALIARLTLDRKEFGLRLFSEKIKGTGWTRLSNHKFMSRPQEDETPEAMDLVRQKTRAELDRLWRELEGVPAALAPIFAKYTPTASGHVQQ